MLLNVYYTCVSIHAICPYSLYAKTHQCQTGFSENLLKHECISFTQCCDTSHFGNTSEIPQVVQLSKIKDDFFCVCVGFFFFLKEKANIAYFGINIHEKSLYSFLVPDMVISWKTHIR